MDASPALSDSIRSRLLPELTGAPATGAHFIHWGRSWYSEGQKLPDDIADQVHLSSAAPGGGTYVIISWYELNGCWTPRLEAFDDSWGELALMSDVIGLLAHLDDQGVSPEQLCAALERLGYADSTPTESQDA